MEWLGQYSSRLFDAGFGVLSLAFAFLFQQWVDPNKRLKRALTLLPFGVITISVGYWQRMQILTTTGLSLILTTFLELSQIRIESGKVNKKHAIRLVLIITCAVAIVLVALGALGSFIR